MKRECWISQAGCVVAAILGLHGGVLATVAQNSPEIVADFAASTARFPAAGLLLASDGNYYGTTYLGGDYGLGTVFTMTPSGSITVLHSFDGSDGANPYAPLVEGADENLYGTTLPQASGTGTIFKITTLTATVAAVAPGAGTATGQVQFLDGKKKLGTATLVNGVATLQVAFNNMGSHDLTATYAGDSSFIGSRSQVFIHTVSR